MPGATVPHPVAVTVFIGLQSLQTVRYESPDTLYLSGSFCPRYPPYILTHRSSDSRTTTSHHDGALPMVYPDKAASALLPMSVTSDTPA